MTKTNITAALSNTRQSAKKAHDTILDLMLKGSALTVVFGGLFGLVIDNEPSQEANTSYHVTEGAYSPPPQTTPGDFIVDEGVETPASSKPFLTEEAKAQMANRINTFSVEVGSPLGADYGMAWVEAGIRVNRHPYALVAVALADTSLGKHLTTPYNLGNVGNTDSCPTCGVGLTSWQQGIDAIADTLVNGYLGNATKLCHLSRGGWNVCPEGPQVNNGKFYASSLENWNRNSVWAESWLHGTEWRMDHSIILSDHYQLNIG